MMASKLPGEQDKGDWKGELKRKANGGLATLAVAEARPTRTAKNPNTSAARMAILSRPGIRSGSRRGCGEYKGTARQGQSSHQDGRRKGENGSIRRWRIKLALKMTVAIRRWRLAQLEQFRDPSHWRTRVRRRNLLGPLLVTRGRPSDRQRQRRLEPSATSAQQPSSPGGGARR